MKYVTEFRDSELVKNLIHSINKITTKHWKIMEVCGGQTHSILHFGLDQLLPEKIELLHGPGCPVCVTPPTVMDFAFKIAQEKNVIFCTFADMMRVPGSYDDNSAFDFFKIRAIGADIRMVYSPLEAVTIAENNPGKEVVFFAVGFETTAPVNALAVVEAAQKNLQNFSLLVSHVLVPPAVETLLESHKNQVQGFLAAGHVCSIMGYKEYETLAQKYKVPFVVTGFEPTDLLEGIYLCVKQLEEGRAEVENQYSRVVKREGNVNALKTVETVFEITDQTWRGLGMIPNSGLKFKKEFQRFDAEKKFQFLKTENKIAAKNRFQCRSGEVLMGSLKPNACEHFRVHCNPESPLGPTMVSGEGACAAYFKYRRADA